MDWQDNKPFLRQESCWRCSFGHGGTTECESPGGIIKVLCDKTHRMVSTKRACYCQMFAPLYPAELHYGKDGIPIRNRTSLDYRTERQWNDVGRQLKENAKGLEMHANGMAIRTYRYYLNEETEAMA